MRHLGLDRSNPMVSALAAALSFEAVVFVLAVPGMILISAVSTATAFWSGGVGVVLCLVALVGLRPGWGYLFAWLAQVVAVAMGILTPMMYVVGLIFAVIWVVSFVLGRRLENRTDGQ